MKSSRSARSLLRTHTNNTQHTQTAAGEGSSNKSTVIKSIRNLFLRASLSLSLAAHKLRSLADEVLSSDEVVNELFLVTSSSSIDSSIMEHDHERGEETSTTTTAAQGTTDNNGDSIQDSTPTWEEFDAVAEADKLRSKLPEGEEFYSGVDVWQKRRDAWTMMRPEDALIVKQRRIDGQLQLSKDNYTTIYTNLVDKGKTLKRPLNLKDTLRIINQGWISSRKWERASQGLP